MSTSTIRYAVVAGGLVTLGIQVLIPRLLHPYFGSGTAVAAAVVAMALAGLAIGYRLGGRPTADPAGRMLGALVVAAVYLVALGVLLRAGVGRNAVVDFGWLVPVAAVLAGLPSLFLGTISPLAIQAFGDGHAGGKTALTTQVSASVFVHGTVANVAGGLLSAFVLAPFVGISLTVIGYGGLLISAAAVIWAANRRTLVTKTGAEQEQTEPETVDTAETWQSEPRSDSPVVYGFLFLAFFSGVASLALEVNASRMLASYFGPTTGLWAAILSVSLGGLAVGYHFGGLIPLPDLNRTLPFVVAANAGWLIAATWLISLFDPRAGLNFSSILVVTTLAFGPPFVLFGMESQILVGAVWREWGRGSMSASAASVFAISSIGGIIGALLGIAYLIPLLGISGLIRLFVAGYLAVLAVTWPSYRRMSAVLAVLVALVPLPSWVWRDTPDRLVAQEEGRYQTIRVYTDDVNYLRFHLGPTYESEVGLRTREPRFGYATTILGLVDDMTGQRALVIGGAGHALAHAFERRGAAVTEVELDPVVRDVSDEVFDPLDGETIIDDGRRYVTGAESETFDVIVIDAFAGPRYVPPHLTTIEFFEQVNRILAPGGTMYLNMISAVDGPGSGPFRALSSSAAGAFDHTGFVRSGGNIVVVGSKAELDEVVSPVVASRSPNTDDKNPMDILLEFAR